MQSKKNAVASIAQGERPLRLHRRRPAALHVRVEVRPTSRGRIPEVCLEKRVWVCTCVRGPFAAAAAADVEGVVCHEATLFASYTWKIGVAQATNSQVQFKQKSLGAQWKHRAFFTIIKGKLLGLHSVLFGPVVFSTGDRGGMRGVLTYHASVGRPPRRRLAVIVPLFVASAPKLRRSSHRLPRTYMARIGIAWRTPPPPLADLKIYGTAPSRLYRVTCSALRPRATTSICWKNTTLRRG